MVELGGALELSTHPDDTLKPHWSTALVRANMVKPLWSTEWSKQVDPLKRRTHPDARLGVGFLGNGNRGLFLVSVTGPSLVTAGQAQRE